MPKILRIVNRFNLGGPSYNAANLTKYLPSEYETLLVGGKHQTHEASSDFILNKAGVDYQILDEMSRSLHWMRDRQALKAIGKIIDAYQPDIVHTHASKAGALGRLAAHRRKVPAIVHTFHGHVFHSYFGPVKTNLVKNTERYLSRLTDAVVAISDTQRDELVHIHKIAPAKKVHVVPLGFELDRFVQNQEAMRAQWRNKHGLQEGEVAIGIIGRLAPIKNHAFFLKIMQSLAQEHGTAFRAFVIGGGELEQGIRAQIAVLGLSDHVTMLGWEKQVEQPLAGLDVVVLTSDNEGTPVSLIEAQAAGRPVVTTDVGGVRDVIRDNGSGYIVGKGDVQDFTEKVKRLVEDANHRDQMGAVGRDWVLERYSHVRLAKDMAALYAGLL